MTRGYLIALALVLPLADCDDSPGATVEAKGPPASFVTGEYEVTALTETLKKADQFAPATRHKPGQSDVRKICSPAGPKPSPDLFADKGDTCTATTDYAKDGRINMSYNCQRPGQGLLTLTFDGKYDDHSFEVEVVTGTYFTGQGDYVLTQRITGKRLGDCVAAAKAG